MRFGPSAGVSVPRDSVFRSEVGVLWIAIIKGVSVVYGSVGSVRARFAPGLALLLSAIVTVVLPVALALGTFGGDLTSWVRWAPWPLAVVAAVGFVATRRGFRSLDTAPAGSAREEALSSAAYGLLGNTLFDTALLVIALLLLALSARDDAF